MRYRYAKQRRLAGKNPILKVSAKLALVVLVTNPASRAGK